MEQLRILHVIGGSEVGGAEEHVLALCKGMDKNTFNPSVACLCKGPFRALLEQNAIPVMEIPMTNPIDIRVVPRLVKYMRAEKIDIVHTHGSRANLTARLAARYLGLPIITTVHSTLSQDYLNKYAAALAILLDRMTTPWADWVITISDYLQSDVKKRGAKQVKTIYNGIDPVRFSEEFDSQAVFSELGIQTGTPLVGTIGRLHPVKGLKYFLMAVEHISQAHPLHKFLVIGSGPQENELKALVIQANIADKVIFTGYVPNVHKLISTLDVLVLPSLAEGMGLVLLEGMFYGKPVVASRVGGIPELVTDMKNGLLVPPGDSIMLAAAINRVLDDQVLTAKLGENGKLRFQQFSLQNMLESTQNIYTAIIHKKGRPGR